MKEPDLFDLTGQSPQRYRTSDPETSRMAATETEPFVGGHQEDILKQLRASKVPLAAEQIGDALGLSHVQVCRRISELIDAGLIEPADKLHKNRSRRMAQRYQARRPT